MNKTHKKSGQGLVEYALIIGLIALAAVIALTNLGTKITDGFYARIQSNVDVAEQTITEAP